MKKRKALFILGNYGRGGAERQAVYLAKWLKAEAGFDVAFLAFRSGGPVEEELREAGIPCETAPFNFFFIDSFREWRWNKTSLSYSAKLRREWKNFAAAMRKFSPDVILPFTYYPNVVAGLSWKASGARLCIWNQRDIGTDGMNGGYVEKLAMKHMPFFVSNSKQGADLIRQRFHAASGRMEIIPNGIQIPEDVPVPAAAFGLSERDEHVVMLANFHPYKDHETLLKAWKLVKEQLSLLPLKLVLAGRFGGTEQKLMQQSEELGIRDSVVFLDSVKDVNGLLSHAEISAFSSRNEGHPNAVLEAMACGLAVAATDIPGCRDALGNDYAFLSPAGDAAMLAQHIIRLLTDKSLRDETGKRNLERIRDEYAVAKMGKRYLALIDRFC